MSAAQAFERLARAITPRIAYTAVALLFLVFGALAAQIYNSVKRELTEVVMARRAAVAHLAAATLSERLDRMVDLGVSLATRVRFAELVSAGQWDAAAQILRGVPSEFRYLDRVVLYDVHGTLMADVPELKGVRGQNFAFRDWYKGVRGEWRPYVSEVYRRAAVPQRHVFAVAVPIVDRTAAPTGILQLQINLETFFDWAKAIDLGAGGSVYVVDGRGVAAFDSSAQAQFADLSARPAVARLLQGGSGVEVNSDYVYAFVPSRHRWGVVVQQPVAPAFAARENQLRRLLVGYGVILVFCAALVGLTIHLVTQNRRAHADRRLLVELERRVGERTAALDSANRELEDLYNNAACGYHSVSKDGVFVKMNDTELKWLGYSREEVIGKMGPRDLHTPESLKLFLERFERFKQTGEARDVEYDFRRKDGSVLSVVLNATAVQDRDGNFVMSRSTIFDNTERKRAEEQIEALNASLKRYTAQLEATNKELESFSYSVSHDLRAPLRAVDGYARMLEEDYAERLDEEGRRLLGVVRSSSKQMGQLIDDLLAFSKLGRQEPAKHRIEMTVLAREVAAELGRDSKARIEASALPPAEADRAMIKQVWSNLIGNALKYSGKREAPRIEIGGRKDGNENVYWVRDNGVGFDMRYAEKLFGVFQRLHGSDEFPGTGVGLAIVQRVIARHGGRVWAEGKPEQGARFYFSLPSVD